MIIIRIPISLKDVEEKYCDFFQTMVKIVVDIEKEIIALNAEMHADLEELLFQDGSLQKNLWGANVYFEPSGKIEFTSLINIRPAQGNKGMEVNDPLIRQKMEQIIRSLILV